MIAALLMLASATTLGGQLDYRSAMHDWRACARRVGTREGVNKASAEGIYHRLETMCAKPLQRLYDATLAVNRRAGNSEGDAHINAGDTVSLEMQEAVGRIQAQIARSEPRCTVTERSIVGAWSDDAVEGVKDEMFPQGDSREIQFKIEGGRNVYREYLHQRPGGEGTWSLRACTLTIVDHGATESYQLVSQRGDRLVLREVGQRERQSFHRIK
jgi:hypothetical protein